MHNRIKFFSIIFFVFINNSLLTAQNNPTWENYTYANEISDFDFEGDTVWVASSGGVSKILPGTGLLEFFNAGNSILNKNRMARITVSKNGEKWISSNYDGLYRYSGNSWIYYYQRSNQNGITSKPSGDANGNMFFFGNDPNTQNFGLVKYDGIQFTFFDSINHLQSTQQTFEILSDYQYNVWLINPYFIFKQDSTNWTLVDSTYQYSKQTAVTPNGIVWQVFAHPERIGKLTGGTWTYYDSIDYNLNLTLGFISSDTAGNIWVSGNKNKLNYLLKYDGVTWTVFDSTSCPALKKGITKIKSAPNGHLWVGTFNGIYEYDGINWIYYDVMPSHFTHYYIRDVLMDTSNVAWIFNLKGYTKKQDTVFTDYIPQYGFNKKVEIDKNNFFWYPLDFQIGQTGPSLVRFDGNNWRFFSSSDCPIFNSGANAIAVDENNIKWIGTTLNGIARYNDTIFSVIDTSNSPLASNQIVNLFCDRKGNLWVETYGIIQKFDGTNWTTYNENPPFPFFYSWDLEQDRFGNAWGCAGSLGVGTKIGMYNGLNWTVFNPTMPAPGTTPTSIAFDHQNHLWVAYLGIGVAEYDGNSWTVFTPNNSPLADDNIQNLYIDKFDNLWISTTYNGVSIFNQNGIQFTHPYPEQKLLSGKVFSDLNANGISDIGEYGLNSQRILVLPDSILLTTDANGNYSCFLSHGNYEVKLIPFPSWQVTSDSTSYHINIDSTSISIPDFGLFASPYHQVDVSLVNGFLYCGTTSPLWIQYQNTGSIIDSGNIILTMDSSWDVISSQPIPASVNDTIYTWYFSNLAPFETRVIVLTTRVPYLNNISVHSNVVSQLISGASVLVDDNYYFLDSVECFDDEYVETEVHPTGSGSQHLTPLLDTLTYTLRFQNMSADTVFFLSIIDSLDSHLDISSLVIEGASHPFSYTISNRVLSVDFNNIQLPDSFQDPASSIGYIRFKVRCHSNTPHLTQINNNAYFTFDFRPFIVSNTVWNKIVNPTGNVFEIKSNEISMYPNPANKFTTLKIKTITGFEEYCLINITGAVQEKKKITSELSAIDLSKFSSGVYFILIYNKETYLGSEKLLILD